MTDSLAGSLRPVSSVSQVRAFPAIQGDEHGCSRVMVGLLFTFAILAWSPLWIVIGFRGLIWVLGVMGAVAVHSSLTGRPMKRWVIAANICIFGLAAIPALYWGAIRVLVTPIFLVASLVLVGQSTRAEVSRFVDIASWFLLVVLIGAVLGFIFAQAGGQPLLHFPNPDGRPNFLYATTFTNSVVGRVIRPAGVYDEPGALSFAVCLVAFMRHALNKDYRLSWLMLILGFITLSLAHLVFVAVFLLAEQFTVRRVLVIASVVLLMAGAVFASGVDEVFRQRLLVRVAITESGELAGDNRSRLMRNATAVIAEDWRVFAVGISPRCMLGSEACEDRVRSICCNPLATLAHHGILIAWPYYLLMVVAVGAGVTGRAGLAFVAVALLFLQRPNVLSIGYSSLAVLAVWLHVTGYRSQRAPHPDLYTHVGDARHAMGSIMTHGVSR